MINPTRRNRNIGTSKQGHGQDNKLVVPFPAVAMKSFYERLGKYKVVERIINEHVFKFVIEETRLDSYHACTIEDIASILGKIPNEDYGAMELIILRQPTRKEETLKCVWGRLIYSYEFEKEYFPAVIIEAVDLDRKFKWDKKLSVESMKELERLREDGHDIHAGKRFYSAEYKLDNIRATQLYRTLPHEFGHYVHYLKEVVTPLANMKGTLNQLDAKIGDDDTSESNPLLNEWDKLDNEYNAEINKLEDLYFALPTNEKEVFAHKYAGKLRNQLINEGYIPFNRILSVDKTKSLGLNLNDFKE